MPETPTPPVQVPPNPAPVTPPAGDPPKPPAGDPPTPPPPAPVVPEKYDLKLADGSPLDPSDIEKVSAFAKAKGFSNEQAQAILDHRHEAAAGLTARQTAYFTEQTTKWAEEVKADKELGGVNFPQTQQHIERAIQRFGTPEFKELVNASGYGNHPEFVRFVVKVGKAMAEDKPLPFWASGGQPATKKTDAEVFYPKTPNA